MDPEIVRLVNETKAELFEQCLNFAECSSSIVASEQCFQSVKGGNNFAPEELSTKASVSATVTSFDTKPRTDKETTLKLFESVGQVDDCFDKLEAFRGESLSPVQNDHTELAYYSDERLSPGTEYDSTEDDDSYEEESEKENFDFVQNLAAWGKSYYHVSFVKENEQYAEQPGNASLPKMKECQRLYIDSIIDSRTIKCRLEYLVKWKDFVYPTQSWIPKSSIDIFPDLIKEYEKRRATEAHALMQIDYDDQSEDESTESVDENEVEEIYDAYKMTDGSLKFIFKLVNNPAPIVIDKTVAYEKYKYEILDFYESRMRFHYPNQDEKEEKVEGETVQK